LSHDGESIVTEEQLPDQAEDWQNRAHDAPREVPLLDVLYHWGAAILLLAPILMALFA